MVSKGVVKRKPSKEEEERRRWIIWGLFGLLFLVILISAGCLLMKEEPLPAQEEVTEQETPQAAPIPEDVKVILTPPSQEVVVAPTPSSGSSGGGGGSGGSSTPAPEPVPELTNETIGNETAKNSTELMLAIESPESLGYDVTEVLVDITSTGEETWFFNGTGNETYTEPVKKNYDKGKHVLKAWTKDKEGKEKKAEVEFEVVQVEDNETAPEDFCEGVVCEGYCDRTTKHFNGVCVEGKCGYKLEEKSEECGYEEPEEPIVNITKPNNYAFNAILKGTFMVYDNGLAETIYMIKNSTGVIEDSTDSLSQNIKVIVSMKGTSDKGEAETDTYRMGEMFYQHLMIEDVLDEWVKITPDTDKKALEEFGVSKNYFKDQSKLDSNLDLVNGTEFLPVGGDKCNAVFLAKKKPTNKFMEVINKLIFWPVSKLKYKLTGNVVAEPKEPAEEVKEDKCRIKIIPDKKIADAMAEEMFLEVMNSSDAMAEFVKFNRYSFMFKKALKNFNLEYELNDEGRIIKTVMSSEFDFTEKKLEKKKDKGFESELEGEKESVPFSVKSSIVIETDFFGYGVQEAIALPDEALNATDIGDFLESLK